MILKLKYLPIFSIALLAIRPFGINLSLLFPLFLFIIFANFISLPKKITLLISFLFSFSLISTAGRGWNIDSSHFVVFFSFTIVFLLFYNVAKKVDEKETLKLVFNFCLISSIFAIIQQVDFIFGFKFAASLHSLPWIIGGTDFTNIFGYNLLRVFGFATEPSHFGYILTPCVVLIAERFIFNNKIIEINVLSALIVFFAFIMTFSISAYTIFLIYILFKTLFIGCLSLKRVLFIILLLASMITVIGKSDAVSSKINRLSNVEMNNISASSGTVLSFVSSLSILSYHYENNGLLLGVGVNNYRNLYDEYSRFNYLPEVINRIDSSSMFIRLMVEIGILPTCIIILIFMQKVIRLRRSLVVLVFSFSTFGFMLRTGDYTSPVFIYFISHFMVYVKNYEYIFSRKNSISSAVLYR